MSYGYARVSTDGQSVDAQVRQLKAAGAHQVLREVASGAKTDRIQLRRALNQLDAGHVFSVTRLDCLARSTRDLLSARWAGPEKDFAAAMARVLTEMGDTPDRRAWFVCALSLAWPDGETATYLGRVDGTVLPAPRGNRGFGYDPLFLPTGAALGYGEMEPAEKHAGSHRARAMAQFVAACIAG